MNEVQTRDEAGELKDFNSFKEAFDYAKNNLAVWKLSVPLSTERGRLRLVRCRDGIWRYDPIIEQAFLKAFKIKETGTRISLVTGEQLAFNKDAFGWTYVP